MASPVTTRGALLQALVLPGYGLELIARVRRETGGRVRLGTGSVYPALEQLEKQGLVRSVIVPPGASGGRPRTYHELTTRGVAAARSERDILLALTKAGEHRALKPEQVALMHDRLNRCASLSAALIDLRRRTLEAMAAQRGR